MKKKKPWFVWFAGSLLFLFLILWIHGLFTSRSWLAYAFHLLRHQAYIFSHAIELDSLATKYPEMSPRQRAKIGLILRAKKYGGQIYGLENSQSFERLVPLPRDTLGWNLTVAYPLEWRLKTFGAPGVAEFGYIGFFDGKLKDRWKESFRQNGFDVYENKIGAYSTLGILADPLFSTYLDFSDYGLVRLIFHEMAHEKLYFSDDSDFSESLASFIEEKAANLFYKEVLKTAGPSFHKKEASREYERFIAVIEEYKKMLSAVYESDAAREEKLEQKAVLMKKLKNEMKSMSEEFRYTGAPRRLAAIDTLNNAVLIQIRRYHPPMRGGFEKLYESCAQEPAPKDTSEKTQNSQFYPLRNPNANEVFVCWFTQLKRLQQCTPETRQQFMTSGEILLEQLYEKCI